MLLSVARARIKSIMKRILVHNEKDTDTVLSMMNLLIVRVSSSQQRESLIKQNSNSRNPSMNAVLPIIGNRLIHLTPILIKKLLKSIRQI